MITVFWDVVNKVIDEADLVLEVIDARFPEETRNREIEAKIKKRNKKLIYVLNKSDLIDKKFSEFKFNFHPYVFVSAKNNLGTTILRKLIFDNIEKKPAYIGVLGYPNTGKSSLINALKQSKGAKTSPIPGYTKGVQLLRLAKEVYLIDTPGVIPYKENDELKHTLINIKDATKIEDPDLIAMKILSLIVKKDRKLIEDNYGIKIEFDDPEEILKQIALKYHWLVKGGLPNIDLTARKIIIDFQKGKIKI